MYPYCKHTRLHPPMPLAFGRVQRTRRSCRIQRPEWLPASCKTSPSPPTVIFFPSPFFLDQYVRIPSKPGSSHPSLSLSTCSIDSNSLHRHLPRHQHMPPFSPSQTPLTDTSISLISALVSPPIYSLVPNTPLHRLILRLSFPFSSHTPFIAPSSIRPSRLPPSSFSSAFKACFPTTRRSSGHPATASSGATINQPTPPPSGTSTSRISSFGQRHRPNRFCLHPLEHHQHFHGFLSSDLDQLELPVHPLAFLVPDPDPEREREDPDTDCSDERGTDHWHPPPLPPPVVDAYDKLAHLFHRIVLSDYPSFLEKCFGRPPTRTPPSPDLHSFPSASYAGHPVSSSVPASSPMSSSTRATSTGPCLHDYAIRAAAHGLGSITQLRPGLLGIPTGSGPAVIASRTKLRPRPSTAPQGPFSHRPRILGSPSLYLRVYDASKAATTPTATSPGRSSLEACSTFARSTRWNTRCVLTSNGSSPSTTPSSPISRP